ncbi:tetratricopeptide repeat protein [Mucilaginibacter sp. Bleaf8]|uniref:tetratricopeptide repeat protein n=1 Tax=Mucilaginibacter sp. Bleaf8 TaxID=2834430 RepID=UPI001BD17098|nr:tetratricopeptide repeat protein [Mucilaginibacter sp. Bleaf8]MBS7563119.1 tetratricopeptide repeat protein [Mucilaginibacter sp. Bleaf8]
MDYQLYNRIQALIERDKIDLALEKIASALAEFPDSDELYSLQASAYLKQKDYKRAQIAVNTGLGLNPENDFLYYLDARLAVQRDEYKLAEKRIDEAIGLNPYQAGYFGLKSAMYIDLGRYDEAITYATEGLDLDPENTMCNNMLSMAQTKSGRAEEAFNRLENMLADDPESELTQANTGYYYLRLGDVKKAKEHFAVALSIDPEFDYARAGMVQAIKATNFFYRKLLQFSYWMEEKGAKFRFGLFLGIYVVIRLVPFLFPLYLILILWTWFTGPVSDMVLYFDKYGRYLMPPDKNKFTQINIGIMLLATIALITGFTVNSVFYVIAFSLFLTVIPVYLFRDVVKTTKRGVLALFACLFLGSGIVALYLTYIAHRSTGPAEMILLLSAVIFSWTVVLLKR